MAFTPDGKSLVAAHHGKLWRIDVTSGRSAQIPFSADIELQMGPLANVRGKANVLPRMLDILASRIPKDVRALRFGVVHVGCRDVADRVAAALRQRFGEREILSAPASPVLATHLGPGAWGIAYQVED